MIDYRSEDVAACGRHFDLVLDIGGCASLRTLRSLATPTGTVVMVGGENEGRWIGPVRRSMYAAALSPFVRQRLIMLVSREHHRSIDPLAELFEQAGSGRRSTRCCRWTRPPGPWIASPPAGCASWCWLFGSGRLGR